MMKIPVSKPLFSGKELEYVTDCMKTGWVSSGGKYIEEFENGFSKYLNAKHSITACNGTAALHLALLSLGIEKGDEVILPNFTMIASANSIVYTGAKPVFVDVEPRTWNIDVDKIEEKITKDTKAIMAVHIFGHPCDMDPILKIANEHGISVVEDAAESIGAEYKGKIVGCLGDVGAFSFYGNKIITTGEGGMVVTNNEETAERIKAFKNHWFDKDRTFIHKNIGFNYRMTNIQAAIGLAQLENIEKHIKIKRDIVQTYNNLLKEVDGVRTPIEEKWAKSVFWMYAVLIQDSFGKDKDVVRKELEKLGVETRLLFAPMNSQPSFAFLGDSNNYPVSEELYKRGFYLPSGLQIDDKEIQYVADSIKNIRLS
ncbi:MAG: DegT/DnrJ/EryC1/StrS aminotransferase family protein [Candidatus Aenigmarchaeota archaeon]|nr:DegT/DnrJ/EryC1/StrS aminotransferase family protein [Candidatus Aenigmarchaeota archaeon]